MAQQGLWAQRDPYGEMILSGRFDWRDERVLKWIENFVRFGQRDSKANVARQSAAVTARYNKNGKRKQYRSTGNLLRSIFWRTWNESNGDVQIFHAQYAYYEKFLELALGKGDPFTELPPDIPGAKWKPITVPGKTRKARPAVPTEMRRNARKFTTFIQDHFSFAGIAIMAYALAAVKPNADVVNQAIFSRGMDISR